MISLFALTCAMSVPAIQDAAVPEDGFRPLFDGASLASWEGDPRFWSVEEGALVGLSTTETPCEETTYLVWQGGEPGDFDLRLSFLVESGNSGVQFRSREVGRWRVAGYQADIEADSSWTGCLYEQDGRGVVATRGERVTYSADGQRTVERFADSDEVLASFRRGAWNDYRIVARGDAMHFELNGVKTCELIDRDPSRRSRAGRIALQLHSGPPMTVRFRDLRVKEYASEVVVDERPQWIWLPGETGANQALCFQRAFELDARPTRARLAGSCDNVMDVFLNGELVVSSSDWARPVWVDLLPGLARGANLIAVRARNEGGPAGLQLELSFDFEDGARRSIFTGADWKVAPGEPAGWKSEPASGPAWVAPALSGPLGVAPWGVLPAPVAATSSGALPAEKIALPPGFRAELVYTVPRASEGSWVSLTDAPGGRLYASAEAGGLFRITPPPLDAPAALCIVERVEVDLGDAQGLLWAFDALYVVVNSFRRQSGLFRLTDTDADGRLDAVELLKAFEGAGEHGPHAVLLGPGGDSLYVLGGNHTKLPAGVVERNWGEDQLLPQKPDPGGHAVGIRAPGGWVCRTDRDGREWELVAWGLRNAYDAAFADDGELFTFDSDMEWDIGLPWYRPTRVLHLVQEGEYGWRTGSGKWPEYYEDSLPAALDVGPGSPTGVVYGRGADFPAPYTEALFIADWAYGWIWAVHLEPRGSSYVGSLEQFASGTPMPVTDLAVAADGALYFTVGGRGTQSALYRVLHDGSAARAASSRGGGGPASGGEARVRRILLESLRPGADALGALEVAWSALDDRDRFLRHAARTALERFDVALWRERALKEERPRASIAALVALARCGAGEDLAPVLAALATLDLAALDEDSALGALRAFGLAFIRLGAGERELRRGVADHLLRYFPDGRRAVDRELCVLLVALEDERVLPGALELLAAAPDQEEAIFHAFVLRNLRAGWTPEQRRAFFRALDELEAGARGGASFEKYLRGIRAEVERDLPPDVVAALRQSVAARGLPEPPALDLTGRTARNWRMEDLEAALARVHVGRSFEQGAAAYRATTCHSCHRLAGEGESSGPDLTGAAGRFQPRDLLEAILTPSTVVSDQYRDVVIEMTDGETWIGRIEAEEAGLVLLRTLPPDEELVELPVVEIETRRTYELSRMPAGLVDALTEEELLDLLAYVLAGGDPAQPAFER